MPDRWVKTNWKEKNEKGTDVCVLSYFVCDEQKCRQLILQQRNTCQVPWVQHFCSDNATCLSVKCFRQLGSLFWVSKINYLTKWTQTKESCCTCMMIMCSYWVTYTQFYFCWGDGEVQKEGWSSESEGSWSLDIKCQSQKSEIWSFVRSLCVSGPVFTEKVSEEPLSLFNPLSEAFNLLPDTPILCTSLKIMYPK